jgi:hypothetical protein
MDQGGTTVDASTQAIADLCGGSITAAVNAHVAAADPHGQYALESTLATVATTGAYGDLSNRPTLGSAAAQNVGTAAGNVVQLDNAGRLPAVDASQLTGLPSGGVSSVSGTAPIVSSGGNTPAISITAATTSAAGSMSGADKQKIDIAVVSDVTGITGADAVTNIVSLTQAEYDAIASPSASTLYVITS